jgi:hypothetical protein
MLEHTKTATELFNEAILLVVVIPAPLNHGLVSPLQGVLSGRSLCLPFYHVVSLFTNSDI